MVKGQSIFKGMEKIIILFKKKDLHQSSLLPHKKKNYEIMREMILCGKTSVTEILVKVR